MLKSFDLYSVPHFFGVNCFACIIDQNIFRFPHWINYLQGMRPFHWYVTHIPYDNVACNWIIVSVYVLTLIIMENLPTPKPHADLFLPSQNNVPTLAKIEMHRFCEWKHTGCAWSFLPKNQSLINKLNNSKMSLYIRAQFSSKCVYWKYANFKNILDVQDCYKHTHRVFWRISFLGNFCIIISVRCETKNGHPKPLGTTVSLIRYWVMSSSEHFWHLKKNP